MTERQTILVVDDETLNIELLAGLLKADSKILVAKSGERALKIAASGKPDLILLDVMMPGMDGYEVCRHLKADEETRGIPVIFVTARNDVDDETLGFELGAVDYIRKPISPPILKARVKTQLALMQQQRELRAAHSVIKSSKERMEEELNVGREIQMSMMPLNFAAFTESGTPSLFARLEPAREVGGDFYDFFELSDSLLCLCVGDVSGKGVPAALFMAVTKTLIRSCAADRRSTAHIVTHVNEVLSEDNDSCMFVTLFIAIFDREIGKLNFTNAGHNPPYIVQNDGQLIRLGARHGPVAGAIPGIAYGEETRLLRDGDTLFVYTDGVTEAMNQAGSLYSEERLAELLREKGRDGSKAAVEACMSSVSQFEAGAERADDITLLAFTFSGVRGASVTRTWNKLQDTAEVNTWFDQFAQSRDLDAALTRKINLVLDDLLSNIISYAYPETDTGQIETGFAFEDGQLQITLIDDGIPFDPLSAAQPDLDTPLEDRALGGLGIFLVRELMDDISYKRDGDRNVLKLSVHAGSPGCNPD
jgi:sigma-B regulation protein RsbU (phosphoserine phosphatase)